MPLEIPVPLRPLKRVAARCRARVIEVDEDVVERRRPFPTCLHEHVAVENAGHRQGKDPSEDHIERAVDITHRATLVAHAPQSCGARVVLVSATFFLS